MNQARMKTLPSSATADRREILRQYVQACVRDSKISLAEMSAAKLVRVLSQDLKVVLGDLGRESAEGLLQVGMGVLMGAAMNVLRKKV